MYPTLAAQTWSETPPWWTVPPSSVLRDVIQYEDGDMYVAADHLAFIHRQTLRGFSTAGHERHDYAYVLSREPDVILPERGLMTDARRDLGDPGVFGEGFAERYQSVSVPLSEGVVNLWRRRE